MNRFAIRYQRPVRCSKLGGLAAMAAMLVPAALLAVPPIVTIDPVPAVVNAAVDTVEINFDQEVVNVDLGDMELTLNGGGNLLPGPAALTTADDIDFTLGALSTLTNAPGNYALTVQISDIENTIGEALAAPATINWRRNAAPTTTGFPDEDVLENAGPVVVNLFNAFDDLEDADNEMVYSVMNVTNPTILSSITVFNLAGFLEATLAPNRSGTSDITVRATDTDGAWVEATLRIIVEPLNQPPSDILLDPTSIFEYAPLASLVGTLSSIDPNNPGAGQTHSYEVVTSPSPFDVVGDQLVVLGQLVGPATITVRVRSTDDGAPPMSLEQDLFVQVLEGNKPPTAISISYDGIAENDPNGTPVGTLTTTDPNPGDTHTYELVYDESGAFAIIGDELVLVDNTKLDFERDREIDVYIKSTDNGTPWNLSYIQYFQINVNDMPDVPVLSRNEPLWVLRGGRTPYNSSRIYIRDTDSPPNFRFIQLLSQPARGRLLILQPDDSEDVVEVGFYFTQQIINEGRLIYEHTAVGDAILIDQWDFWYTDFNSNMQGPDVARVNITIANTPPSLVNNVGIVVPVYSLTQLTSTELLLADAEQTAIDLTYIVTELPTRGELRRIGQPVEVGGFFTQQDINEGAVEYFTDNFAGGGDYFRFRFTDNIEPNLSEEFIFPIFITTPPNTDPELDPAATLEATVIVNSAVVITTGMLNIVDAEQPAGLLEYTVQTPPAFGFLNMETFTNTRAPLGPTGRFTQADVNNGKLTYVSNGTTTPTDSFTLMFEDGIGAPLGPITFTVNYSTSLIEWEQFD